MKVQDIFERIKEFCRETHGASNYHKETLFIRGSADEEFAPFRYLAKKVENLSDVQQLMELGFIYSSHDYIDQSSFKQWYENQFGKRLMAKTLKEISLAFFQEKTEIFQALENIHHGYESLRKSHILLNGKNMPTQLGEWYAKCIFGLKQVKSTSQRGFDFELDGKRVEIKVHWGDIPSPKGVKIKKSLVELSDYVVIMYLTANFLIRDICMLDSDFVSRKFAGKGHTVFLKDPSVATYFFSRSVKQFDKITDKSALMKFASPNLAMKLAEKLQ
jgi:hypothetical protein